MRSGWTMLTLLCHLSGRYNTANNGRYVIPNPFEPLTSFHHVSFIDPMTFSFLFFCLQYTCIGELIPWLGHGTQPLPPFGPYSTRSMGDFSRQSRHQRGPFMRPSTSGDSACKPSPVPVVPLHPPKKNPNCLAGWPQVRCNNFGYLNGINQWYDGIISFIQ